MKTDKRLNMLNVMGNYELDAKKTRIILYLGEKVEASAMELAEKFETDPTLINHRIKLMAKHKYIGVSPNKLIGWKGRKITQFKLRKAGEELCMKLLGLEPK